MITKLFYRLAGFFLLSLFVSQVAAECSLLTDKQIVAVKEPLVQLLQVEDQNAQYGYVPRGTIKNIDHLKTALIALVDARLACEKSLTIKPVDIQEDLLKVLKLHELDEVNAIYGYDLQIIVEEPPATVGLVMVQISFGIPCGDDNVLLAYRYRDKAWHRDLVWKSKPYHMISDAYSDYFDYLVLPIKQNESTKVVIVHGSSWCSASWEAMKFDVVKLADEKTQQATLMHRQLITYKIHDVINLKKLAEGFELYADVAMLDSDLLTRQGIYRYKVDGDTIIREQPLANNARDFVDEWLVLAPATAKNFTVKDKDGELLSIQSTLKGRYGFYGAVKRCEEDDLYQVELAFNGTPENDKEETYYFYVKPIHNGYLMHSVAIEPNSSCTGPDIMAK